MSICQQWFTLRRGKISRVVSTQRQQAMADVSVLLEETLNVSGALLVKSFGHQSTTIKRFAATNEQVLAVQMRQVMFGRRWSSIMHIFYALLPAMVYYVVSTVAKFVEQTWTMVVLAAPDQSGLPAFLPHSSR